MPYNVIEYLSNCMSMEDGSIGTTRISKLVFVHRKAEGRKGLFLEEVARD